MALTWAAGEKLRAAKLNAASAVGVVLGSYASTGPSDVIAWTTTEKIGASLASIPLVSGRLYAVEFIGLGNAASAGSNMFLKLRYAAGGAVAITDAIVPGGLAAPNISRGAAGDNNPVGVRGFLQAASTASYTFGLSGRMALSTGNIPADTGNHGWTFSVTCVRSEY